MSEITDDCGSSKSKNTMPENESERENLSPKKTESESESDCGSSETSTLVYGHEPFEKYRSQILELCHSLWPSLDQEITIERMLGGSYNRIVAISVATFKPDRPTQHILRVPRFESARLDREIAILRYVKQCTTIPIAEVSAFDLSSDNPLKDPYMIQNRITGINLHSIYPNLSHERKRVVAAEYGCMLQELQTITSSVPGVVESVVIEGNDQGFKIVPFEIVSPFTSESVPEFDGPAVIAPTSQTILEMLSSLFGRWKAQALTCNPSSTFKGDYMDKLTTVAVEMDQLGYFTENTHVLCHLDFEARNIMVNLQADLSISGVLDWDSAIFAPIFMCAAPPFWIWGWSDEENEDETKANDIPSTPENQELKRIFEDAVGQKILGYMYKPQYRLARSVGQLALFGIHSTETIKVVESVLKEWAALKVLRTTSDE